MARINTYCILCLIVLFVFDTYAQQDCLVSQYWNRNPNTNAESTTSNQIQIITKEQILFSGYTMVSDVFQLIDGWTMSTYNGDKWTMQSNGTGTYQSQNWTLLLDGAHIELLQIDAQHINTLGISVNDIERIEIVNSTGNYLGEWNDKGIIHIITKRNVKGLTLRALVSNGVEIGDPHLQVNSNPNLNVHEYGSNISSFIGYKHNRWSIGFNQYFNTYFFRDTSIYMQPLIADYNSSVNAVNQLLNGRFQLAYSGKKVTHQLMVIANRGNEIILPLEFTPPHAINNRFYIAAYNLRWVLPKGIIQYKTSLTQRKVNGGIDGILQHDQNYFTQNVNYTLTKSTAKGQLTAQYGIAHEFIETQLKHLLIKDSNNTQHLFRPYFSYTYPLTKKSNVFTDISIAVTTHNTLPKAVLGYYKKSSLITNWSVVASYAQRDLTENNDYAQFLAFTNFSPSFTNQQPSSVSSLDYYFNINVNKYFKISFNSGIKQLYNERLLSPQTDNFGPTFRHDINYIDQTRWVNRLNIHYDMLKNTLFDLNYLQTAVLTDEWKNNNISRHRFSFVITQTLPMRFYIWARYYYQSSTYWVNPAYVINRSSITPENMFVRIAPMHTFDVGITKKLLKEYLVTNISIRNVLNTTERYQALGATFYMRIFISIKININAFGKANTSSP
jgi:hypothetical protein